MMSMEGTAAAPELRAGEAAASASMARDGTILSAPVTHSAWPTSPPRPCTRLNTPGGQPATCMICASAVAVAGVSSDCLATTLLPQAMAGATFHDSWYSGRFPAGKSSRPSRDSKQ